MLKEVFYVVSRSFNNLGGIYSYKLRNNNSIDPYDFVELSDCSYITFSNNKKFLFATSQDREGYKVSSFSVKKNGKLELYSSCSTVNHGGCFITPNKNDTKLYIANYHASTVTELDLHDGKLIQVNKIVKFPYKSYPYGVRFSPDNKFLLVTLLGRDEIRVYKVENSCVDFQNYQTVSVAKSNGPRHLLFDNKRNDMFVINELANSISVYGYDKEFKTDFKYQVSTISNCKNELSKAAAIIMNRNKSFMFASNRGLDSIACFQFNERGVYESKQLFLLPAESPRDIRFIDQKSTLMAVACERGNELIFVDFKDNQLSLNENKIQLHRPTCILN